MTSVLNRMLCLLAVPFVFVLLAQEASAQESTKGVLAAQVRAQGYSCDKPISAKKDAKRSRPDEAFWVLRCEHKSYTMRLTPDMAAHIQRLK
jgi:hypothetical protein